MAAETTNGAPVSAPLADVPAGSAGAVASSLAYASDFDVPPGCTAAPVMRMP